jgi:hypothetical protein
MQSKIKTIFNHFLSFSNTIIMSAMTWSGSMSLLSLLGFSHPWQWLLCYGMMTPLLAFLAYYTYCITLTRIQISKTPFESMKNSTVLSISFKIILVAMINLFYSYAWQNALSSFLPFWFIAPCIMGCILCNALFMDDGLTTLNTLPRAKKATYAALVCLIIYQSHLIPIPHYSVITFLLTLIFLCILLRYPLKKNKKEFLLVLLISLHSLGEIFLPSIGAKLLFSHLPLSLQGIIPFIILGIYLQEFLSNFSSTQEPSNHALTSIRAHMGCFAIGFSIAAINIGEYCHHLTLSKTHITAPLIGLLVSIALATMITERNNAAFYINKGIKAPATSTNLNKRATPAPTRQDPKIATNLNKSAEPAPTRQDPKIATNLNKSAKAKKAITSAIERHKTP